MLASIISQYLRENRRLVIPQLGAFLVKEPNGDIVFTTLITRDDGVLRQLILDAGVSELEASGMIRRICFDVRYVMENGGEYLLDGFGRFSLLRSGALQFVVVAQPAKVVVETAACELDVMNSEDQELGEISKEEGRSPATDHNSNLRGVSQSEFRYSNRTNRTSHRGGVDWWLFVGVGAIALAVGAILYGFLRSGAEW